MKEHKNYGKYYGELTYIGPATEIDDIYINDNSVSDYINTLYELGATEIYIDLHSDYTDTIFFKITKSTNLKELMIWIAAKRPHEFSEESNNYFRMWFD